MPHEPSSRLRTELSFRREEWHFLFRLPGRLVVAATLTDPGTPRRRVAQGLAGIDAIAAGRFSASRLVRDVVAAIYDESEDRPPPGERLADPQTVVPETLIACRSAAGMLARRVGRAETDAYRHWFESIAARVCQAGHADALSVPAARPLAEGQRRFLAAVSAAFEIGVASG